MKNFLIARVWENYEFAFVDALNDDKIALAFAPSERIELPTSRYTKRKQFKIVPLFPEYVFLTFRTPSPRYQYLKDRAGFMELVSLADQFAELRPKFMREVLEAEIRKGKSVVKDRVTKRILEYKAGDKVLVSKEGHVFDGQQATIVENREKQFLVYLDLFGGSMPATIDIDSITMLPDSFKTEAKNILGVQKENILQNGRIER